MAANETQDTIAEAFLQYQSTLDAEEDNRRHLEDRARGLEKVESRISAVLQEIHCSDGSEGAKTVIAKTEPLFEEARQLLRQIAFIMTPGQIFKSENYVRQIIQRLVFHACFAEFCKTNDMLRLESVAAFLQLETDTTAPLPLVIEDYLLGLLLLPSELSRLAMNSASRGDHELPMVICRFLTSMDRAFRLLNLKNGSIRHRFDGLKYELKTVEQVVYGLKFMNRKSHEQEKNMD